MSNVLAQDAAKLAPTMDGEANFPFDVAVNKAMERKVGKSGLTTSRLNLFKGNLEAGLVSAVCADYRNHFAAIYGKTDRLPPDVYVKIQDECAKAINVKLAAINADNVISQRTYYYVHQKKRIVTERLANVGENLIGFDKQHFAINLFIGQAERRLTDLQKKVTPDYELEKAVKARIMDLTVTRTFIEQEIAQQKLKEAK